MQIPIYQPTITAVEKQYVNECLDSTWISSKGAFISLFEKRFAAFTGSNYAVAVSNGTVALHLALLALGIGPDDEVLVPTLSYVASANAIKYCQARPVFVEASPKTWQMDPEDLVERITPRTKAIMVVHLYGYPCEMDRLCQIAAEHNLALVEDCAEAIGTRYRNAHVGNFGAVATYSFFGNKTISCGEGGMVVTDDPHIDEKVRHLKGQGLAKGKEYFHDVLGYNYRLTNMQAALGVGQLERIEDLLQAKRTIAHLYQGQLEGTPLVFLAEESHLTNSYWMCSFLAQNEKQRDGIRTHLKENGIETRPLFSPIHTMPYYSGKRGDFPVAEDLASRGINLPSWPGLTGEMITEICTRIQEVIQ